MSAGEFEVTRYELETRNGGSICRIRVQPETLAATFNSVANAAPAGAITLGLYAKVSKGRRGYGIGPRMATIRWTSTPPSGYSDDLVRIPVLTPATAAAWLNGTTGTYLGAAAEIESVSGETYR